LLSAMVCLPRKESVQVVQAVQNVQPVKSSMQPTSF
jgi:hypothetical protein